MTMRKALSLATVALLGAFGSAACGGGSRDDNSDDVVTPDATPTPDADEESSCTDLTTGAQTGSILDPLLFDFEINGDYEGYVVFYEPEAGTFDLSAGNDANFATCTHCFRVFDTTAGSTTEWFQSGGMLTLNEAPANANLSGSVTDLTLTEVIIADNGTSMPVEGGTCLSLGSFDLSVISLVPANNTCNGAVAIKVGSTTAGSTLHALNDIAAGLNGSTCTGLPQAGADVTFKVAHRSNHVRVHCNAHRRDL